MTELEVTIVSRIDADMTVEFTFKHITTDEHEAEELGANDRRILDAYVAGYGAA